MEKGYVYIFSNTEHPELIKIGKTNHNPRQRARTLSNQTGAIGHFIVEWYIEIPNSDLAELLLHDKLKEFLFEKEYFKVSINQAIQICSALIIEYFDLKTPRGFIRNEIVFDEIIAKMNKQIKGLKTSLKYTIPENHQKTKDIILNLQNEIQQIIIFKNSIFLETSRSLF